MAIKRYKPTSPGRRLMTVATFEEITLDEAGEVAAGHQEEQGRAQQPGPHHRAPPGGGHKRFYRIIDFKRNKLGIPGRVATVEYDPNRSARIALVHLRRRREALHPGPAGPQGGRHDHVGQRRGDPRGQRPAAPQYPARHPDPQHRDAGRARRANGAQRGQRPPS